MYRLLRLSAVAAVACALLVLPGSASGNPGDLDPLFGSGGVATPAAPTDYSFGAFGAGEQPGGKVVVGSQRQYLSTSAGITVQRMNGDGSPDESFGAGGYGIFTPPNGFWAPSAMAVSSTGKIAITGYRFASPDYQVFVLLFNADGSLDSNFDGDGSNLCAGNGAVCTQVDASKKQDQGRAVAFQSDGKIVVGGSSQLASGYTSMAALRYTETGALDSSFSGDGMAQISVGPWSSFANALVIDSGGNVVLAGVSQGKGPNWNNVEVYADALGLVRLDSSGAVDGSFHSKPANYTGPDFTDGVMISPRVEWTYGSAYDAALAPGDKIVVTGYANNVSPSPTGSSVVVARVGSDGQLDATFGGSGRTLVDIGPHAGGYSARVDSFGRTLIAGYTDLNTDQQTLTMRMTSAGDLDPLFQGSGYRVFTSNSVGIDPASVVTSDGKWVLVGGSANTRWAALRLLLADPIPVPPPAEPVISINSPAKKKFKRSKLRTLAGTAGPAGLVKKVEIALLRKDSKLLKKKRRCQWLSSTKAKFKKVKATKGKCAKPYYRKTTGTERWKYRLTKKLPAGSYALTARVTLTDGRSAEHSYMFRLER